MVRSSKRKAALTARSMAFDEAGTPYVLVREDKQLALCALVDGRLQLLRKVPLKYFWFEVATVDGKRWALLREDTRSSPGAVAACELSGTDKVKTLTTPEPGYRVMPWHLATSTCSGAIYGLSERSIYRFAGARGWIDLESEPEARTTDETRAAFFAVFGNGVARRRLGDGSWVELHAHRYDIFREALIYDRGRDELIAATRSSLHVVKVDGSGSSTVELGAKIWCLVAHGGELHGYTHGVVRVGRDGSLGEPLARGEISRDRCLFAGGGALYFLAGRTIHVLRDGRWAAIDIGSMKLDLQPPPKADVGAWFDRPHDVTTRELVAAITEERLADTGRLLVLADHLTERGDPRGELISLHCLPRANAAQDKRIAELVRAHGDAWLGPLAKVASRGTVELAGGFVRALTLKQSTEKLLPTLLGRPEWATVARLDAMYWKPQAVIALTGDEALGRLDTLAHLRGAAALREVTPRPWRALSFRWSLSDDDVDALGVVHDALPELRELEITTEIRDALWSCPLVRQLRVLKVVSGAQGVVAVVALWERELAHLVELTAQPYAGNHGQWALRLARGDGGPTLTLSHKSLYSKGSGRPNQPYEAALAVLAALRPISVSRVEIGATSVSTPPTDATRQAIETCVAKWHAVVDWPM